MPHVVAGPCGGTGCRWAPRPRGPGLRFPQRAPGGARRNTASATPGSPCGLRPGLRETPLPRLISPLRGFDREVAVSGGSAPANGAVASPPAISRRPFGPETARRARATCRHECLMPGARCLPPAGNGNANGSVPMPPAERRYECPMPSAAVYRFPVMTYFISLALVIPAVPRAFRFRPSFM